MLQSMRLQGVRYDLVTEQQQIQRKALKYLTWDNWFSLIKKKNLLMFSLPALYYETSIEPGSFLCFLRAVLSGLFKMLSPGFEVLQIPTK